MILMDRNITMDAFKYGKCFVIVLFCRFIFGFIFRVKNYTIFIILTITSCMKTKKYWKFTSKTSNNQKLQIN